MSDRKFYDFITPHDLMRYLMPGVIFFFCGFLFEIWATVLWKTISEKKQYCTPFITTIDLIKKNIGINLNNGNWMHLLLFFILVLIVAYIAGHIISSFSSLLIDRVLIAKGWGYPYEHILNIPEKNAPRVAHYIFFWVNFFIVLLYIILGIICCLNIKIFICVFILSIVIMFFILIIIPFLETRSLSNSSKHSFWVIDIPYKCIKSILEIFLGKKFINLKMDDEFIRSYRVYFKQKFKYNHEEAGTNNFWFPYLFLKEEGGIIGENITSWRRLIMYTRNLSTALYFGFLYSFGWLLLCHFSICIEQIPLNKLIYHRQLILLWVIPFLYFMGFIIILLRYLYLNGSYFTKLVFRSFVLSCDRNSYDIQDY